jgi:hypothetical protein
METKSSLSILKRLIVVCAALGVTYYLWSVKLEAAGSILFGIGGVILCRSMVRAGVFPNPFGNDRDFATRQIFWRILKSAGCYLAAFLWAIMGALGVRYRVLPDTNFVAYGFIGAPLVTLILTGTYFLATGGFKAMFGSSNSRSS